MLHLQAAWPHESQLPSFSVQPDFAAIDELRELAASTATSDGLALHNIDLGCLEALGATEESSLVICMPIMRFALFVMVHRIAVLRMGMRVPSVVARTCVSPVCQMIIMSLLGMVVR